MNESDKYLENEIKDLRGRLSYEDCKVFDTALERRYRVGIDKGWTTKVVRSASFAIALGLIFILGAFTFGGRFAWGINNFPETECDVIAKEEALEELSVSDFRWMALPGTDLVKGQVGNMECYRLQHEGQLFCFQQID